ncbi:MAG: glutathione S-transferase [Burkholderiales bacterium]
MKLLSSPASPFGRKVTMVIAVKNLGQQVEVATVDATRGDATLNSANPLGRIPALVIDSGETLHDSHVICEYLDTLGSGPMLVPRAGPERWRTLTLASLGDGLIEQALLQVYEGRYRPEGMRVQSWVDRLQSKIDRALAMLEAAPPAWGAHPDYGHLTVAAALGYMDFRHAGRWRAAHPRMVDWLARFAAAVPAYAASAPPAA